MLNKLLIFGCPGSIEIAQAISQEIGEDGIGQAEWVQFTVGEGKFFLPESIRGANCWVIQVFNRNLEDDNIVLQFDQARILLRTLKDCGAASINLAMPLLPNPRQDEQGKREGLIFLMRAKDLLSLGIDKVLTFDLHKAATAGFFDGHCVHLFTSFTFIPLLRKEFGSFDVVVAADAGAGKMAEFYAKQLQCSAKGMLKPCDRSERGRNIRHRERELAGDIAGQKVLFVDEMVDTCGTTKTGIDYLIDEKKASQVVAAIAHTIAAKEGPKELKAICQRDEVLGYWTTDSVIQKEGFWQTIPSKTKVVSLVPRMAETIKALHQGGSVAGAYQI